MTDADGSDWPPIRSTPHVVYERDGYVVSCDCGIGRNHDNEKDVDDYRAERVKSARAELLRRATQRGQRVKSSAGRCVCGQRAGANHWRDCPAYKGKNPSPPELPPGWVYPPIELPPGEYLVSSGGWCAPSDVLHSYADADVNAVSRLYDELLRDFSDDVVHEEGNKVSTVDSQVAAELRRREETAELERKLALIDRYGFDSYADGDVLRFKKTYPGGSEKISRTGRRYVDEPQTYTYAAIRAVGRWYVTGRASDLPEGGATWSEFIQFLVSGISTESVERLVPVEPFTPRIITGYGSSEPAVRECREPVADVESTDQSLVDLQSEEHPF